MGAAVARARSRPPTMAGCRRSCRSRSRRGRATRWWRSTRRRGATPRWRSSPLCPVSAARTARTRPTLAGRQRRRGRAGVRVRRVGRARGQGDPRHDRRAGGGGRRVRVARATPANAALKALKAYGGRHRPVGDQRGVRLGDAELGADAHRRGPRERERWRGRDRAPDRRLGARILGALVHELRRREGGYGCAAICSGGGQGDAVIVQV